MKALVIGATGATGKPLIQHLLEKEDFTEIVAFTRKPIGINHPKLRNEIINFNDFNSWKHLVKGDVAFSCLGTTLKDAGSKKAQYTIDFDYQYQFALSAKENSVKSLVLVSSYQANPKALFFYPRMKGELEEAIIELNFSQTIIFRPGMLKREGTDRIGEKIGLKLITSLNALGLFKQQKPIDTHDLAKAMINAIQLKPNGISIIEMNHNIISMT